MKNLFILLKKSKFFTSKLAHSFRNLKIQQRLILFFLILSLIPLLINSFFTYKSSSNAIKTKISTYSMQVMNQLSENITRELDRLENDSVEIEFSDIVQNTLKNYKNLSEWDIDNVQNTLNNNLVKMFSFLNDVSDVLIYTNNKDRMIAYGDRGIQYKLKEDYLENYLRMLSEKKGTPIWTETTRENEEHLYDSESEQPGKSNGILIGRAIKSLEEGNIIGSLIIRSNERALSNIYKNIDIGNGADIFVIDNNNKVVSSRNTTQIPIAKEYKNKLLIDHINKAINDGTRVFNLKIEDSQYLVTFTPIPKANWYVVSTIPFSYLNSETKRIGVNSALLALICFLLAIFLSYLFSRSISSPLKKLVNGMNEAKKGNLSIYIKDKSNDEIGEVTNNFNLMLNEIKNLMVNVKSKEKQKRNAEFKALQAQINPHFLSNTLNTVKWLANIQKAENIENIITSLIQLLQVSMGKGEDFISISEEIEYIKSYINIQEYRYYDKFTVKYEFEEEILNFKILKFLLQPVVENSLMHGIEPMQGQGLIVVKGFRYEDNIKITITDNGVGIPEEKLKKILFKDELNNKSKFSGIGISNVHERIQLYFGEQYGLQIESVPGMFTTTEITIPIKE